MDTGSTGIVVSSNFFTPGPNDVYVAQATQTYTSSGKVEHGSFYLTNVVIYENSTTPLATARVTVLDVTSETCLSGYSTCVANPHPTNVAYMGIGFDRGSSSTQPPAPYNNTNPFINIVSLASGQPISSLAPGYIISDSGVTLGLSSSATNNFAFVKLLPNTANNPPQAAPAWLGAPLTVLAGGQRSSGSTTAFLNTGREFYAGFDYICDPINGYVGYRWNGTVSSAFGQVTPSLALSGNVNLPAGFISNLPTVLYGATRLLEAGGGIISNSISGPFGLTIGSGLVALTGANTYTGATIVSSGTRIAGNNEAFGPGFVSLAPDTTLSFMSGSNFTLANNFRISGDPNFTPPAGTTQTISGVISDGATPGFLGMLGPGTLVLSGANTYSGGTTISAGTLQLSGAGTLGAPSGTLGVSGGVLDLGGTTQTTGALTLSGGTIEDGTLRSSSFGVPGGTVSAVLAGGGTLTKSGGGTVVLSGNNIYTGPTNINAGVLDVTGSIADSSLTIVASGA